MNPRYALVALIPVLLHLHMTVRSAGLSVTIPGAVLVVAAISLACLVLAVLIARSLHGFRSCPHLRTVT